MTCIWRQEVLYTSMHNLISFTIHPNVSHHSQGLTASCLVVEVGDDKEARGIPVSIMDIISRHVHLLVRPL